MPGHRSFLRIGDICYSLVNVQLTITLSEDINPINSKDYHCDFLKRYNYYPKLEKAWTFGEKDDVPLSRVFKLVFLSSFRIYQWIDIDFKTRPSCVEHFDSGLITLLYQDNVGGLEVQRPSDGKWIPIAPQDDVFVINTGRAMERITNGVAHATKHRVRIGAFPWRTTISND